MKLTESYVPHKLNMTSPLDVGASGGCGARRGRRESATRFKSTLGQTNVQPSWRASIVPSWAQESNDKKGTTKSIEQIMSRGAGTEYSRCEELLKSTCGVVGGTTKYRL